MPWNFLASFVDESYKLQNKRVNYGLMFLYHGLYFANKYIADLLEKQSFKGIKIHLFLYE